MTKKLLSKFRGSLPRIRPVPEYRYSILLVDVVGTQVLESHPIEYIGNSPVVILLAKEGELAENVNKAFAASKKGQFVLVIDGQDNKTFMLKA